MIDGGTKGIFVKNVTYLLKNIDLFFKIHLKSLVN